MGSGPSDPSQQPTAGKGWEVPMGQVRRPLISGLGVVNLVHNDALPFSLASFAMLRSSRHFLVLGRRSSNHLRISRAPLRSRRVSGRQGRRGW